MSDLPEWHVQPIHSLPPEFLAAVQSYVPESVSTSVSTGGTYAAQLLWQRGIREPLQLAGFLNANAYRPASPFELGPELQRAVERLQQAHQRQERVAIWGDFDVDGITATAVLWEGLGEFLPPPQLTYVIPNRLTESHGLSPAGIAALAEQGYSLIVTCDTGSTQLAEIEYARQRGIDVIITDHHVLLNERPPVVALINPRALPPDHPLAHLSGVAVAYKLVEALYETMPQVPRRPVTDLLDLVAIGLIADLVELTGDCRYLAQRGIEQLQQYAHQAAPPRPGIAQLLAFCRRSGDRPTDISFGLGPRINAISRIHGDAHFCVELLTSRDPERCSQLAEAAEFANSRRRALQRQVVQQVQTKLKHLDLSTTGVIVLSDPQWSVGILGLVAGQIAQEYQRPTILLSTEGTEDLDGNPTGLARGSARSVNGIDLYGLMQQQAHLLHRFGGHPLAAGLSLPVENIPVLTAALNQQILTQTAVAESVDKALSADLTVSVSALGKSLFRELKLLEPCGVGNPVPKLLIQNCWFTRVWHKKIGDHTGKPIEYIKTEFELRDDSCDLGFPGTWWGHYKDELPVGRCDAIVELDFNGYEDARRKKRYEVRLVAVRSHSSLSVATPASPTSIDWILDWRTERPVQAPEDAAILQMTTCPRCWDEVQTWCQRAVQTQRRLALAYGNPEQRSPTELWQQLVGIAKYLSRTGSTATRHQLTEKLGISDYALELGLNGLQAMGFSGNWSEADRTVRLVWQPPTRDSALLTAMRQFVDAVQEEQFQQRYFYEVPLVTIQAFAAQAVQPVPTHLPSPIPNQDSTQSNNSGDGATPAA